MKDLMHDLMEAGRDASVVGVVMLLAAMLVYGVGCAGAHQGHGHGLTAPNKALAKAWKPGKRCEKNCLKNGLTTVNMVVLNPEPKGNVKGGVAAEHATQAITAILGFKPVLKIVLYGKKKGKTFFLTVVTGISSPTTVAAKR